MNAWPLSSTRPSRLFSRSVAAYLRLRCPPPSRRPDRNGCRAAGPRRGGWLVPRARFFLGGDRLLGRLRLRCARRLLERAELLPGDRPLRRLRSGLLRDDLLGRALRFALAAADSWAFAALVFLAAIVQSSIQEPRGTGRVRYRIRFPTTMFELFTWTTANGFKISSALEELGVPYRVPPLWSSKGEPFAREFLGQAGFALKQVRRWSSTRPHACMKA